MNSINTKVFIVCFVFVFQLINNLHAQSLPQIFVHTDRDLYFPGDIVWYKVYILNEGKLDTTVQNVYMDWADGNDTIIKSDIILASRGVAVGNFNVPHDTKANYLQLNVYTSLLADYKNLGYYRSFAVMQSDYKADSNINNNNISNSLSKDSRIQIIKNDSTVYSIILRNPQDAEIVLKGRINNTDIFNQKIALKANKAVKIPIDKHVLESGLLQVKMFDTGGKELDRNSILVEMNQLILEPEVKISNQSLTIDLKEVDVATLSLAVVHAELPYDTLHNIKNEIIFNSLSQHNYPSAQNIANNDFNNFDWHWYELDKLNLKNEEEDMLTLSANLKLEPGELKSFNKKIHKLQENGYKFRGVSVSSQAINEAEPNYNLYQFGQDFEIKMPETLVFGEMYFTTKLADPEFSKLKFDVDYVFRKIPLPKAIYKPEWENFSIPKQLKSRWLPIYDSYSQHLFTAIDTVSISKREKYKLMRGVEVVGDNYIGDSDVFDIRSDDFVRKHGGIVEDYMSKLNGRYGVIFVNTRVNMPELNLLDQNQYLKQENPDVGYVLNTSYRYYEDIRSIPLADIAYIRVFFNISGSQNIFSGYSTNKKVVVQIVELPDSEKKSWYSVDKKIEGYVEPKTFDQIGKMTVWWNPFVIVNSETGTTSIKLPVELKGKRVTIQGVTNSGKLVYFNRIVE